MATKPRITGSLNPQVIYTETSGTFTCTFTHDDDICSTIITMEIMTINASLEITKISQEDTFSSEGDLIHYVVTVINNGTVMLSDIKVSDSLTNLDETIGSLDPGSSRTFSTSYSVSWSDIERGYVENRAVAYFIYEGVDYTAEAEDRIDAVQGNSITVTKVASEDSFTAEGDQINYMIFVTNNGNTALTEINIADPLTDLDETIPSLAPNETVVLNTTYTVARNDINAGFVHNITKAAYRHRGEDFEVSSSLTVNAVRNHHISIVKVAAENSFSAVGDEINYTITITNEGNAILADLSVIDPLTGLEHNIPTISPGESITLRTAYSVTQYDINRGFVENSALVSYDFNGEHYEEAAVEMVDAIQNCNIILNKVAVTDSYEYEGDVLNYMIFISNNGNVVLSNVIVNDSLTGLTKIIPFLLPNDSGVFLTSYKVVQKDVAIGQVNSIASARYSFGGKVFERISSVTVKAARDYDLEIEKTAYGESFYAEGDEINFRIFVTNTGNKTLTDILVSDPLTGLNKFISSLAPGESLTFNTTYTVTLNDVNNGSVKNKAIASYNINGKNCEEIAVTTVDAFQYHSIYFA